MTPHDGLEIVALFAGPLSAVLITWWLQLRRQRADRRMDIFRTLMRTRRTPVFLEHVGALNLVEIEFNGDQAVIAALRKLLEHFGTSHARLPAEDATPGLDPVTAGQRETQFNDRLFRERQSLLAKLLHQMAKALRFRIEQLEIFEGGYTPQGWADELSEQQAARRYLIDLAIGRKVVPVMMVDPPKPSVAGREH